MMRVFCPICKAEFSVETSEPLPGHFPFCSDRCRLIDLGRWLDGKYQIPVEESGELGPPSSPPED